MKKVRIDKWLWSVRLFKSRSMASDACKTGKIKSNSNNLKPSYLLSGGEVIEVKKNGFNLIFKVNILLDKRVSAVLAAPCFEDLTTLEEMNKYKEWYIGKSGSEYRHRGEGRPTKKERREIDEFKGMYFDENDPGFS
ncbi:MAG: RNA-binding S4 domain-containing protein [Saprospiraceae bacterium]|nr:RNA-binding S4 domain-containing protein [Saprospiraceae bacterium]